MGAEALVVGDGDAAHAPDRVEGLHDRLANVRGGFVRRALLAATCLGEPFRLSLGIFYFPSTLDLAQVASMLTYASSVTAPISFPVWVVPSSCGGSEARGIDRRRYGTQEKRFYRKPMPQARGRDFSVVHPV